MAPLVVIRNCHRAQRRRGAKPEEPLEDVTISRHRAPQRNRNVAHAPEIERASNIQGHNNNNNSSSNVSSLLSFPKWPTRICSKDSSSRCALDTFDGLRPFRCVLCTNVLADKDDVVSKTFFGRTGRAFLMNCMFNIDTGPAKSRHLMTGLHTIADVSCAQCHAIVGWKYSKAQQASEQYKEGKFIMELAAVEAARDEEDDDDDDNNDDDDE